MPDSCHESGMMAYGAMSLSINGVLAKEGANWSPASAISSVFFVVWKDWVMTDTVPSSPRFLCRLTALITTTARLSMPLNDRGISDYVPSINKCAEHNKITENFMCRPVCPVDSIYPRLSLLHIFGKDKKKLIPFSLAALFCRFEHL